MVSSVGGVIEELGDRRGTAHAVTVVAREHVTIGISASDRVHMIRLLADPKAAAADFSRPGQTTLRRSIAQACPAPRRTRGSRPWSQDRRE